MALKIMENNGVFTVKGSLNAETAKLLKNHIELLLLYCDNVVININELTEIDSTGFSVLKKLSNYSKKESQSLLITGNVCEELCGSPSTNYVA
ncbi:hypothetical protein BWZ20_07005 [Winogradskyella sp. J14-2]|uniref:STAS domain-containing protein n=1 Tax=Winogradskyella sp. J14-2 TaxID=1936080 RepID=UPI000972BF34|nr:STAS domain-containing protein [Winogradskyella sp. J14-2]APY08062.1 hypothetical protein BWZ20_07005 [Winogradskyella sp. J14-2]